MLRRWTLRRAESGAGEAGALPLAASVEYSTEAIPHGELPGIEPVAEAVEQRPGARRKRVTKKRIALAVLVLLVIAMGFAYSRKDEFSAQAADFSRNVIGDENTARVESWYFRIKDKTDQVKYKLFGGTTNPFDENKVVVQLVPRSPARTVLIDLSAAPSLTSLAIPNLFKPRPLELPKTTPLRDQLEQGEGVWTTSGLPRTNPDDILMAKTFIRPDKTRPYALVGVLLLDSRRIRLSITGGTVDPGGDRGVKGPGVIPQADQKNLLLAWNGGFKGPHGGFGMVADGKEYRPLRAGLATIAVYKDGSIKMGEWGRDLNPDENIVAARQNAVLLVDHGEVSKRTSEGNDTWGYVQVNSSDFITWRSAVGLTKDGNLIVAAGNSLSAESLAKALWAAGAYTAMQLDINSPYVLTSAFFPQPDGSLKAERFMDTMPDSPSRWFKQQERDFMYVTIDESRFR